jgi:hypothetical protein
MQPRKKRKNSFERAVAEDKTKLAVFPILDIHELAKV